MASELGRLDRQDIEALLPHRAPFLFVDRVVHQEGGTLVAEWDVPHDLPAFAGHFPDRPVLPGVLISELAFQAGALLVYTTSPEDRAATGLPVLTRIQDARFKRIVGPGETLRAEVRLTERLGMARYVTAKVTSGGKLVARLDCVLALATVDAEGA